MSFCYESAFSAGDANYSLLFGDESEYHEGTFRYADSIGNTYEVDVEVRARGNYRRRRNVCRFAPLRLIFSGEQPPNAIFEGQEKLKLVTHCDSGRSIYEQNILKEYLAYRIFGLLTEQSFRIRLLHVTYLDTDRDNQPLTKYAFLIEDRDSVAVRTGMPLSSVKQIDLSELEPAQTNLVTVFQYFIGNTDFSAVLGAADDICCRRQVRTGTLRFRPGRDSECDICCT